MMPVQPGETLVGVAVSHDGRVLCQIYARADQGATVRSMIARIDAAHPNSRTAAIRGEFTSDGTRHAPGDGRLLASREPRRLDDGRFYTGWIFE